jgi:hypothetical protein
MNTLGLLLNLVGVVLLFSVGIPFQIPADTKVGRWSASGVALRMKGLDDFYTILGLIGLSALVLGTLLQILASLSRRK